MAIINLKKRGVECKIVYYGPGRCIFRVWCRINPKSTLTVKAAIGYQHVGIWMKSKEVAKGLYCDHGPGVDILIGNRML